MNVNMTLFIMTPISSVAITHDGNYIAAREGNEIYRFNKEGEVLWKYEIDGSINFSFCASVSITSDGNYIVAGDEDGTVHLLSNEGTLLQSFRTGSRTIEAVAITPDGKYIAASGETAGGERVSIC